MDKEVRVQHHFPKLLDRVLHAIHCEKLTLYDAWSMYAPKDISFGKYWARTLEVGINGSDYVPHNLI